MNAELIASEPIPRYMKKFIDIFAGIRLSLRSKIMLSFFTVILLLSAINIMLMMEVLRFNRQYDTIITNITTANSINGYIKPAIDAEMWSIVSGKTEFDEGNQYQIIQDVNAQIELMMLNAESDKSRIKLEVIHRTIGTLTHYIDKMGTQIAQGSRVAENELVLDDIRGVSDVVEESVQDYMLFEVSQAEQQYKENQARFTRLSILYTILLPGVIVFSILAAWIISASIYIPIKKLHDVTTTITGTDLQALVTNNNVDEITELGISFNIMIGKIRDLLNAKIQEQENLKKAELKTLQAQINPHFLYNTLDTIVWMAEANKTDQVIDIVRALSSFFRIALSRGKDWISLQQEIEHVRSYLIIQKMRYRDILDYRIEMDADLLDSTILKLTLQPLVENALYHGIKTKRNGGTVVVKAHRTDPNMLMLEVEDDGVGFTPYKLAQIQASLAEDGDGISMKEGGFGLENVNKRIKLYYGEQYGVSIESQYRGGTKVTVAIPLSELQTVKNEEKQVMTLFVKRVAILLLLILPLASCQNEAVSDLPDPVDQLEQNEGKKTYEGLVVGFSQIGAESEWRTGNTASIKEAAESLGVELIFSDGQQKQENQIKAIRTFIAQQVDVIGVSPVVETGWESVFQEAKDAGIPIILVDRRADVPEDLYTAYLGSDFREEGKNAARVMADLLVDGGNIVELVGTVGSAPAIDRYEGFREIIKAYPEIEIIASESGDFTRARGEEVMGDLLQLYGDKIDAVYAHNDDMAIGAIQAIEANGLKPGQDIKIVSIDAIREAFQAMIDGKLNATIECNPLLGPQFFDLALKVVNGEPVSKWTPSEEKIFYPEGAAEILPSRKY